MSDDMHDERDQDIQSQPDLELASWDRRAFLARMAALGGGALLAGAAPSAALGRRGLDAVLAAPRGGGHLTEASTIGVTNLNPLFGAHEGGAGDWGAHMMFPGLMTSDAAGNVHPLLAAAPPTLSADKLTITFKLHKGVRFTDGTELTARDVAYTYGIFANPKYAVTNTAHQGQFVPHFASVVPHGKYTVVFRLKNVWPAFLSSNAHIGIVPEHVLGKLSPTELNTADFNTKPTVSDGPFKFGSFQPGQQVTLVRNPKGFPGPALLDTYIFRVLSNSTAILNALETGEVDLGPLDPSLLSQARSIPSITVYSYAKNAIDLLFYQMDPAKPGSDIFGDVRVRQALLYGLDRAAMVKALYFGQAVVGDSGMPGSSWAHTSTGLTSYPYNKAKAGALLDAAGWTMGSGGVRQKNGKKLSFTLLSVSGQAPYPDMAASLQNQWSQIGVDANPQLMDFNSLVNIWTSTRNFDAMLVPVNFPADPDLTIIWASSAAVPGGFNASHWTSPQVDTLLKDAASTYNVAERKSLYAKFQKTYMDALPAAPLFYPKALYGVNKRVGGLIGVLGAFDGFQRAWMQHVYVKDGK